MTSSPVSDAAAIAAPILLAPTVTKLQARHRGAVLVAGSHGGKYAAFLALHAGVRALILSDAGIGLDGAGVAGVLALDQVGAGIPAAAVDVWSARIGDAEDMYARGRISTVNRSAAACGCRVGMPVVDAALLLQRAVGQRTAAALALPAMTEDRHVIRPGSHAAPAIGALDSASLVRASDRDTLLILGSHGAMPGAKPHAALAVQARVAAFNDAGIGIDDAGLSRLPVLEARGIAAVTVAAQTARIGEAMSSWHTGRLSACNALAVQMGAAVGQRLQDFYSRLHNEEKQ